MKKFLSAAICTLLLSICTVTPVTADTTGNSGGVDYAPDVTWESLETVSDYTLSYSSMTRGRADCEVLLPVTKATAAIAEGDRIVLPSNEENPAGAALTVTKIVADKEVLRLMCEEPKALSDFVEHIDVSGCAAFFPEEATGSGPSVHARGIGITAGNQAVNAGRIDYRFDHTVLNNAAVLNGSASIEISSIEYRLNIDAGLHGTVVEDFYFAVNHTVHMDADISFQTAGQRTGGELALGTVPFVLSGTGVSGEITFWLTYDATGNVTVSYTLSNYAGITYESGAYRPFAQNSHAFAAAAGLNFSSGPKMQFILRFGGRITLLDLTLNSGLTGNGSMQISSAAGSHAASYMDLYAYLNMHPGTDGLINRALSLRDTEIWNAASSPFHKTFH